MSDLVEIGALAIWRTRDARFPPRVRRPNPDGFDAVSGALDFVREEAAAVISDIEKAGYRIVPVEPTEEMAGAGGIAILTAWSKDEQADERQVYAAMLAAAPKVS